MISEPQLYIGIDPGQAGGLAVLNGHTPAVIHLEPMPATEQDVWYWLNSIPRDGKDCFAVLEKVGGYMPGSSGNIGSAMFKFGASVGMLRAFLVAAGIPFEEVQPGVWQRALGVSPRKKTETKASHKNKLKQVAGRLFPEVKITLKTCDAILLAEYCRRKRTGTLKST